MEDFEKLGAFYLGKEYDLDQEELKDDLVLYDSKDLTTHGVCVGMTGSGKTGLCVSLLEEAAIDGIPAICIDPKGDLGNLMLQFPGLTPQEFRPWIDEGEAKRKGMTPDEFAKSTAKLWKDGLAKWGEDGDRIKMLMDSAEVMIYTPGSNAGRQITVLRSFDAPPKAVLEDSDAMRERTSSAVSGLLALLGIDADPVRSREHILLSNILDRAWRDGKNLKLADIIGQIQNPPFKKVGVFDMDSFYPAKDRFDLAIQMNGILASPGFSNWLKGDPLDISKLLYTETGKPRIAIMSIAHLSDAERMFFVTILLNEILTWMRSQPGTSSLRALLYMDEIFGYFPPSANPPSKMPMLTLLKQARAFGLGVMMATQNPVDLDYKGLSNCGTWFIGRLQTDRDKMRLLDGLESASADANSEFDRSRMDKILSSVGSRRFLLHNVHEDGPVIFETRWAMSYLRGPLTKDQIETLMADKKTPISSGITRMVRSDAAAASAASAPAASSRSAAVEEDEEPEATRPILGAGVNEFFLPVEERLSRKDRLVYRPHIAGTAKVHYSRSTYKIDEYIEVTVLGELDDDGRIDWEAADTLLGERVRFDEEPEDDEADFAELHPKATSAKGYGTWEKGMVTHLYQNCTLKLWHCPDLKMYSKAGETEGAFRGRIGHAAREERDEAVAKLRKKFAAKMKTLEDRHRRAEARVERERQEYESARTSSMISIGSSLLGALMGRKTMSVTNMRRAGTSMRRVGSANKQKGDIGRAEDDAFAIQQELADLDRELQESIYEMEAEMSADELELEELELRCTKSHTDIRDFGLVWAPWRVDKSGIAEPLFDLRD